MRAAVVLAFASAACGRLGFDALGTELGGDDAGPLPVTCGAPVAETCNGIDDNCNGVVDEGCACSPVATSVTETPGYYTSMAVWTGSSLIQVGTDSATVGLWPITDGALDAYVPVFNGAAGTTSGDATAAWSGGVFAVAFEHDVNVVEVALYQPGSGGVTRMQLDTMYPGASPHILWAGDRFVVEWQTAASDIVMREVSPDGASLGPETVLVPAAGGQVGSIQMSDTATLACLRAGDGTAQVIAVDASGAHTHAIPIGTGTSCELLPIPGGYLAWYHTPSTSPVPLAFLDAAGNVTGTAALPDGAYIDVAIARTPSGFWVLASTTPALYTHSVDAIELDAHGAVTQAPVPQEQDLQAYLWSPPRVVVTSGRRISAWSTNPGGAPSTYKLAQTCN